MRHPTDGTLRRLLDEPAGVADADREHVTGCPACLTGLAAARRDADAASAALRLDGPAADVDAGWRRLLAAAPPRRAAARPYRWRAALRSPVIAVAGVIALLTGASAAAAADWLQIFRTEQVAPITVTQADLLKLPDLSAYGTLKIEQEPHVREAPGPAEAQRLTGLTVPQVGRLPRGVTGEPRYQVGGRVSASFTFSTAKAAAAARAAGKPLPAPPAGLDGSQFRLTAGPGLAAIWSEARGVPALAVARAVAPIGYSSGIPFATARDYLLALPGLPPSVASQLRSFTADGKTLPLVVQADRQTSYRTDVGGKPAVVLTTRDGAMAGVVWVDNGVVTAVGGTLGGDEVLSVARGLRS